MIRYLLVFTFCISNILIAQHKFMEIPKCTEADVLKTKSDIQQDAPAEVLYSSVRNIINSSTGLMETTVFKRIKIYKKEKADEFLNVEIPIYQNNSNDREVVSNVKAITYNIENGKLVTTPVEKDSKFKSKENKNITIQKFAFENVKDGSVIEYKYNKDTPFIQELPKIYFEMDIPIVYEEYILDAPRPYGYSINLLGSLIPKYKEVGEKMVYNESYNVWRFGFENVKPFVAEDYMRNSKNYISSIRPEINSTFFNNQFKSYTTSWKDVAKKLQEYEDFGEQLSKKSLAKALLTPDMINAPNNAKKAEEIYNFVQKNYNWDETIGIFTDKGIKNMLTTKIGNAAELNLLLVMMMREAGLNANPIILKTVKSGSLNFASPSITDPNYVIAAVENDDKTISIFDATSKLLSPNILHPRAYNYNGVLIKKDDAVVLDINNFTTSQTFLTVNAKLNSDGTFSGNFKDRDTKTFSLLVSEQYEEDKEAFKKVYLDKYPFSISNLKSGIVNDKDFESSMDFNSDTFVDAIGNKMVFNPLLFLHQEKHDFNQTGVRKYPIEFISPYEKIKEVTITIPEGYQFETLPKSKKFKTDDDYIDYNYVITQHGNTINVKTVIKVADSNFPKEYYPAFKQIFDGISKLEGQLVTVVKK